LNVIRGLDVSRPGEADDNNVATLQVCSY
jgi:hypothetical protein